MAISITINLKYHKFLPIMPIIYFRQQAIPCQEGNNLRKVLLKAGLSPHNGNAQWFNCKGMGTCGTCAVEITGSVSDKTKVEKWRLNFPPHKESDGLRLACQCKVKGEELHLTKHQGFWGSELP